MVVYPPHRIPVDLVRKQIAGTKSRWLETRQSSSLRDAVVRVRATIRRPWAVFLLSGAPLPPPRRPKGAQHEIVRARLSSAVLGHAAAPLDASHEPRGGGSCGVGGMSSLGSQHLDTRSLRDTHALPKCLTGCSYFLATRAFRAIVTRTTYREGGQGESGRPLEPFATYSAAFFLSRCSLPRLYPIVTLPP